MHVKFKTALNALAHRCNYQLTEFDLGLYTEAAQEMGWQAAVAALTQIYRDTSAGGRFPSVNELTKRSNPAGLSDEDLAREAASLIADAVTRHGWNRPDAARQHIGELGWRVVDLSGGWRVVCDTLTYENLPTLIAQWRQLAIGQALKARAGLVGPPSLPTSVTRALRLVTDLAQQCERK